jgi:hypothetical protein
MIDRMLPVQMKLRGTTSRRATLDAFATLAETMPPHDQRDFQGRPFPYLTKPKRATPILKCPAAIRRISPARYRNHRTCEVLIRASAKPSCHTSADGQSRILRLIAIGRTTHTCECKLLKRALARLTPAVIRVTIRQLKLAIDPADFALSGGIEPWPCRVARKCAGRQQDGYRSACKRLHKSAGVHRRQPKIHPAFPQGSRPACIHETRAISFASPSTRSPARRRSSPPSSLRELLWRRHVPSRPLHFARWQCSQPFTTLRSYIHDRR